MIILITGASSEIGKAIAAKFSDEKYELILQCNKNANKLIEWSKQLEINCEIHACDFNDNSQLDYFISKLKSIDILINAAAVTKTDLLVNLTDEDILKMLQVNIFALTKICRAVIPQMLVKRKGIIVNISSVAAQRGNRGQTVYGGTKGYIESFTKAMAAEYGTKGLRANCVAPGAIEAGSLKELLLVAPDEVKKSIALNRLGTPKDVASLVYFLCTDEASFITGQTFNVDGGFQRGI